MGSLQPILAQVPTFIEQAVMSADPEEENVLMSDFDSILSTPPLRPGLEEMAAMDVEADLMEIRQPIPPTPITSQQIEQLFTTSQILSDYGIKFTPLDSGIWQLSLKNQRYRVTFDIQQFDETPSLRLMSFGDPLFEELLKKAIQSTEKLN